MIRFIIFVILVAASLLAGCGPANPPLVVEPDAPTLSSPVAQPISPLATASEASSENVTAVAVDDQAEVDLNWNTSPDALILSATSCCGHVTRPVLMNYIPDARIWGDGRILWVQRDGSEGRQVLEGRLTPDQLQALLQRFDEAGFFSWQERYANESVADAAETCLSVELAGQAKKVCEYVEGAPPAFHDLHTEVANGAGATGTPYVPERGYLTAYPLDFLPQPPPRIDLEWPADSLGLSLEQAVNGVWVEGEALQLAWEVVNAHWVGMFVQEGEKYYQLSVQVPGVSMVEPPAQ